MDKVTRLGLIIGGRSDEHEVSVMSGVSVMKHLDTTLFQIVPIGISKEGHWINLNAHYETLGSGLLEEAVLESKISEATEDTTALAWNALIRETDVVFPILHGPYGEDGTIQGLFEMLGKPYVGAKVAASAVCMDKGFTKRLLRDAGIPVVPWVEAHREAYASDKEIILQSVKDELGWPVFVKPANLGSSVGISKVKREEDLDNALKAAFAHDSKVLIEKGIDCRELECAVLGNFKAEASCVGEIIPAHEFYDYEAKYFCDGDSRLIIPAELDPTVQDYIRGMALDAYLLLGISGLSRVDFFMDRKTGRVMLNEINTMPGFTRFSMYPMLWSQSGVGYKELLTRLVQLALEEQ